MTNSTSPTSSKKAGTDCPYAVALLNTQAEDADGSVQSSNSFHDQLENHPILEATKQNCPAFADACPFKGASSPDQIKETLLQIPSSHYEMKSFVQVLSGLHVDSSNADEKYQLPGGCPVPPEIKNQVGAFRHAMEDRSLAAIMAKLAQQYEQEQALENNSVSSSSDDPMTIEQSPQQQEQHNDKSTEPPQDVDMESRHHRQSLSDSLKTGTAVAHEQAENVHFVKNFIRGQIDRHLYGKMILSLYYVYEALEEALDQHAPANFEPCHFPKELARLQTLNEDVEYWLGANSVPQPTPATVDYCRRIQYLSAHEPLLLLAHSYTRYLGDLSGGKILARVARRALGLERNGTGVVEGLAFYHFENIPSAKVFKDQYRQALDDLPLTATQIERLVQEANVAFLLNMRLFEELDVAANVPGASVRSMEEVLAFGPDGEKAVHLGSEAASDQCPFLMQKKEQEQGAHSQSSMKAKGARCPWPFVVFHDPVQFARDWQTWALLGLILCFCWSQLASPSSSITN